MFAWYCVAVRTSCGRKQREPLRDATDVFFFVCVFFAFLSIRFLFATLPSVLLLRSCFRFKLTRYSHAGLREEEGSGKEEVYKQQQQQQHTHTHRERGKKNRQDLPVPESEVHLWLQWLLYLCWIQCISEITTIITTEVLRASCGTALLWTVNNNNEKKKKKEYNGNKKKRVNKKGGSLADCCHRLPCPLFFFSLC